MTDTPETLAVDIKYIKDDVAEIKTDLKDLSEKVDKNEEKARNTYLTKETFEAEFKPVRNVIYGLVGAILLAVIAAVLALVVKGGV